MTFDLTEDRALSASRYPITELLSALTSGPSLATVFGAKGGYLPVIISDVAERAKRPIVVILPEAAHAQAFYEGLSSTTSAGHSAHPPVLLPPPEISPYAGVSADRSTTLDRVAALRAAASLAPGQVLVTCALGWSRRSVPAAEFEACSMTVEVDEDIDVDVLRGRLVAGGYASVGLVEDPGTFSVRGDIVDVFPAGATLPVRMELYGDMVETIRTFDADTQRGTADLTSFSFGPASEELLTDTTRTTLRNRLAVLANGLKIASNRVSAVLRDLNEGVRFFGAESLLPGFHESLESVADRVPKGTGVVVVDADACANELERWLEARRREFEREIEHGELQFPIEEWMLEEGLFEASLDSGTFRLDVRQIVSDTTAANTFGFPSLDNADLVRVRKQRAGGDGAVHAVLDVLEEWRGLYGRVLFVCGSRGTMDRLASLMRSYGAAAQTLKKPPALNVPAPLPCQTYELMLGDLADGFRSPALGVAVVTDRELLGRAARRSGRAAAQEVASLTSFKELQPNDLVVHIDFGVARYRGLERMDAGGVPNDFLAMEYADGDRLYLPVYRLDRVQKYVGSNVFQRLDKLGGTSWERTKERVKRQLADIADELLRVYAERAAQKGFKYSEPDESFAEFEAAFPYDETPHQAAAIADVLGDMTSDKPMDRLLCGDVGFGKTEVAIRATYKAVIDGKQVGVLVPTTVLAEQHGKSFRARFRHTAARVEVLSRFRSAAEMREIEADLAAGKVDVVVGTHRLLSKDIKFKDLGLLIVDEEQRFGVTHKEKIKRMRTMVDVLTMSATPIPRTLEMAMLGIRDLSVILTPPPGRLAVRTHIAQFKETALKDAIDHELQRGGQVYFVHNRVDTIYAMADELRRFAPGARVAVAHAQMKDTELEQVMLRFLNRDVDVLVTTTIIESGIDISTANTMFVNDADRFGLAQLHQLRGRIGRSSVRAYCYLLVKDPKRLQPEAKRRLEVLQQHTDLGAGIQIAQHDLDMRGAGNILGRDQSGHVEAVGFELYSELLQETIAEMRGEGPGQNYEPDVNIPVAAYIPENYVRDVSQRLMFYKRYSMAKTEEELFDVHAELQERYGDAAQPVENLRDVVRLKIEMKAIGAKKLEAGKKAVVIELLPTTPLSPDKVIGLIRDSGGVYEFRPEMTVVRRLKGVESKDILAAALRVSREVAACG